MKKIESKEYKKVILDILKYFDKVCRENDIKYTLIGGSLIGAIRDKGIIPWDDDIDVVMNKKEFDKLSKILLDNEHEYYRLYNNTISKNYPMTYSKIIDIRTTIKEPNLVEVDNYGAFIDIFVNHSIPNNELLRTIHYYRVRMLQSLINGTLFNDKYISNEKGIKKIRSYIGKICGNRRLQKKYHKIIAKYDRINTEYVMKDYIGITKNRNFIPSKYFDEYIDVDFEDMKAMAIKEYDIYLKKLFGDYMTPPPKEGQICHNIEAYWKEGF